MSYSTSKPKLKDTWVKLSGGKYVLMQCDIQGLTSHGSKFIWVAPDSGKNELDTWAHETIHTALPNASEEQVERIAGDIAEVLWTVGYRRMLVPRKLPKARKPKNKKK